MADRSVKVTLRANVQDFKNQIGQAATSLDDLVKKGDKTGQASQTMMGRVTQSMQLQREAWTTAGTALTVMGTAITGVGIAALTTGISYNTLQQTSRAALESITGSAEAANRQMDKLDEFASTSPFAKDVFIRAQQQMLGFGIEAQKVVPYLDAIQNAVAATGGSNHDVAELSRIFSQISASAKITATDLREFGNRGVDAATIIGSQMGMTGAEIRESITAGTLDAGEALDALAAGMMVTYENAADNVKNTITGAFDRVKAAWRDLSGDLAAPLVGPEGGGLLVGLLNATADLMRAFQGLPDPIKNTVAALGGIAGVGSLAAGAFLLLAPRVMDSVVAFKALRDLNLISMAGGLSGLAAAVGKFGAIGSGIAAITMLADSVTGLNTMNTVAVDDMAQALIVMGAEATTTNDALSKLFTSRFALPWKEKDIYSFADALDHLTPRLETMFGDGIGDKFDRTFDSGKIERITAEITYFDQAWAQMVNSGHAGVAAEQYGQMIDLMVESGASAAEATGHFQKYQAAVLESGEALPGVVENWREIHALLDGGAPMQLPDGSTVWNYAEATGEAADQADRLAEAWERQIGSIGDLIDHHRRLAGEAMSIIDAEVAHREAAEGLTGALDDQSIAFDTATGRFDGYAEAGETAHKASQDYAQSMWDVAEAMYASGASQDEVLERMNEMRDEYVNQIDGLQGVGDKAGEVADQYHMFPEEIATSFDLETQNALDALEFIEGRFVTLDGTELRVDGDVTPLDSKVNDYLGLLVDVNGEITIDGNTFSAEVTWLELLNHINETRGVAPIDADDSLAQDVLHMFGGDVRAAEEFAKINANDDLGQDVLAYFRRDVDRSFDEVGVGADTSQGTRDVDTLLTNTRGKSASISVNANTLNFTNAVAGLIGRTVGTAYVNLSPRTSASVYASGGYVSGPGTATSDSIPAWLSNGEYVIKANSVAKYGKSFFDQLNAGRYAQGGYVSARSAAAPVVNVSAPSMEGMQLTGSLRIGDALVPIVDGRIERALETQGRWS